MMSLPIENLLFRKPIWAMALVSFSLQVIWFLGSEIPLNTDSMWHHLGSRYALQHPEILVNTWYRPLATLAFIPGALISGYSGSALMAIIYSTLATVQTALLAKDLKLERPALAGILLLFQVAFFRMSFTVMMESLFLLIILTSLRLSLRGYDRWASFLVSLSPLVRLEGVVVLMMWALVSIRDKKWWDLPLLAFGSLVWLTLSQLVHGSFFEFVSQNPYPFQLGVMIFPLKGILRNFDYGFGPVILVLIEAGAISLLFAPTRLFISKWKRVHLTFFSLFVFMTFLFPNLHPLPEYYFTLNFPRYWVVASPWFALVALAGLNMIQNLESFKKGEIKILEGVLIFQILVLVGVVASNVYEKKIFSLSLVILVFLAIFSSLPYLSVIRSRFGKMKWEVPLLAFCLVALILRAEPLRKGTHDVLTKKAVEYVKKVEKPNGVVSALAGIYYLTDLNPYRYGPNRKKEGLPFETIWIWDNWAAGRWLKIPRSYFDSSGHYKLMKSFKAEGHEISVYRRTIDRP